MYNTYRNNSSDTYTNTFRYSLNTSIKLLSELNNQLKNRKLGDLILLPPRVLNDDNLFLDDWTVKDLDEKLNVKCHVYTEPMSEFFNVLKTIVI